MIGFILQAKTLVPEEQGDVGKSSSVKKKSEREGTCSVSSPKKTVEEVASDSV